MDNRPPVAPVDERLDERAAEWLAAMPAELSRQRAILERLLAAMAERPALTGLSVGCSLGRGAGDAWSDIDAGLAVAADRWPDVVSEVEEVLAGLADVADALTQRWPFGKHGDARHVFTQYADGTQLSLVVAPGEWWGGRAPGEVVLRDTDGSFAGERLPRVLRASAEDVREWAFWGWIALADLVKYCARGSAWEALARLGEAREQVWRLWAVATGADYPTYGLTAVLDTPSAGTPPGMEGTVAGLDVDELLAAARRLADVLRTAAHSAAAVVPGSRLPQGMAAHVGGVLAAASARPPAR